MRRAAIALLLWASCTFSGAPVTGSDASIDAPADAAIDGPDLPRGNRVSCDPLTPITSESPGVHLVSNVTDLRAVLGSILEDETIALEGGTYDLSLGSITIDVDGVTLRSASGQRGDAILLGNPGLTRLVSVRANRVTIASLTLRSSRRPITVTPNVGQVETGSVLTDLAVEDFEEVGIEVLSNSGNNSFSNDGTISCSTISQPTFPSACAGFAVGVDLRGPSDGWRVTENIIGPVCTVTPSPTTVHTGVRASRKNRFAVVDHNVVRNFHRGVQSGELTPVAPACDGQDGAGWDAYNSLICANIVAYDDPIAGTSSDRGILFRHSCSSTAVYNTIAWAMGPPLGLRFDGDGSLVEHANNAVTSTIGGTQPSEPPLSGPELDQLLSSAFTSFPGDLRLATNQPGALDLADVARIEEFCSWDLDGVERDPTNPGFGAFAPTGARTKGE